MRTTKRETVDLETAIGELTACKTTRKLRAKLKRMNIRGRRAACETCPIALYLQLRCGGDVRVGQYVISRGFGTRRLTTGVPALIRRFISSFDKGRYPELEE